MNILIDALSEILHQIEHDSKLIEIKDANSGDMLRFIQNYLPQTIEIQLRIISKYGFTADNTGIFFFIFK
jgi:hypothetical protein